jgi:outer membrane protein assembly factor BamB
MAAFIRVYGMLSEQRPVKKAQKIYRLLKKGVLPYSARLGWSFKTGGVVDSSPAIGLDGTIYVGSWDDKLYAINPDGSLKWSFKTGYLVDSSPAIGSDGTIYVGSWDNKLYAIYGSSSLADTPWPMFGHDLRHTSRVGSP